MNIRLFNAVSVACVAMVLLCYGLYPVWRIVPGFDANLHLTTFAELGVLYIMTLMALLTVARMFSVTLRPAAPVWSGVVHWQLLVVGLLMALFVLLQLDFLAQPIGGGDEPSHANGKLREWLALARTDRHVKFSLFGLLIAGTVAATGQLYAGAGSRRRVLLGIGSAMVLALCVWGLIWISQQTARPWGMNARFTPFGSIVRMLGFAGLGPTETGTRIFSTLYATGIGLLVYLAVKDSCGKTVALCGAVIALSSPGLFHSAHLDYRDTGGAFFVTLIVLTLSRYIQRRDPAWLLVACFAIGAGYLERRPVAVLLALCAIAALFEILRTRRENVTTGNSVRLVISRGLILTVPVVMVAPWIYITTPVNPRGYQFYSSNFTDPSLLLGYFTMPYSLLWLPVGLMALVGVAICIWRRTAVGLLALGAYLCLYVLFTGDDPIWIPSMRFSINFIPLIAILAAVSLTLITHQWIRRAMVAVLGVVLIGATLSWTSQKETWLSQAEPTVNKRGRIKVLREEKQYPWNQAAAHLRQSGVTEFRSCEALKSGTPFNFYWSRTPGHTRKRFVDTGSDKRTPLVVSEFASFCRDNGAEYMMLSLRDRGMGLESPALENIDGNNLETMSVDGFSLIKLFRNRHYAVALFSVN